MESFTFLRPTFQVGKAKQRLYFFRKLHQTHLPHRVLSFYRSTTQSLLTCCCTAEHRRSRQKVIRAAEWVIGTSLPSLINIYTGRLKQKGSVVIRDPSHTGLFPFTSSGELRRQFSSGPSFASLLQMPVHSAHRGLFKANQTAPM